MRDVAQKTAALSTLWRLVLCVSMCISIVMEFSLSLMRYLRYRLSYDCNKTYSFKSSLKISGIINCYIRMDTSRVMISSLSICRFYC